MSTHGAHTLYFNTILQLKGSRLLGEIQGWDSECIDNSGTSFGAKSVLSAGVAGRNEKKEKQVKINK